VTGRSRGFLLLLCCDVAAEYVSVQVCVAALVKAAAYVSVQVYFAAPVKAAAYASVQVCVAALVKAAAYAAVQVYFAALVKAAAYVPVQGSTGLHGASESNECLWPPVRLLSCGLTNHSADNKILCDWPKPHRTPPLVSTESKSGSGAGGVRWSYRCRYR
jgi:hypothetical protein